MYYKKDNSAPTYSVQSVEEIMKIVEEARTPPRSSTPVAGFGWQEEDEQEDNSKKPEEEQEEEEDAEDEYDKQVKQVHASGEFQLSWVFLSSSTGRLQTGDIVIMWQLMVTLPFCSLQSCFSFFSFIFSFLLFDAATV